ncbi:hypothetical protein Acid345_4452 [Candidatus Koribacter versatilis Ellin345]|uniref:VOC domain-containing protein n=1 Tax=Koribacter versatilis (strain Ellin345) TaxID=204669 RepID=Q1II48_KORVE|nr:VOC family protein [Candidatus Koribacter versatilis]ABF43452.1 hypothetical protein Acid345_4452 [Candidatus Koribacter versatilis Ellin345]
MTRLTSTLTFAAILLCFSPVAFAQGHCRDGYQTPDCPLSAKVATAPIPAVFAPTGWKTVALDHITFEMPDYRREEVFYEALMGWKLKSDDGKEAVLDIGNWGTVVLKQAPERSEAAVTNFCFVIEPWDAKTVEGELSKRGLHPVADNDGKGFESFHIKDPDGFDLQVSNGKGLARARKTQLPLPLAKPIPFPSTKWNTVWLDHISFKVSNYKESASFYSNLLGWKSTYDEGSQNELMIGNVGDIIIRGGNPNDPHFKKDAPRHAEVDHISYGILPWNSDAVKAELIKRGLEATVDTSTHDDIDVAAYKSYHTTTPNGYNLQMSFVTRENRLALSNAVKPKTSNE